MQAAYAHYLSHIVLVVFSACIYGLYEKNIDSQLKCFEGKYEISYFVIEPALQFLSTVSVNNSWQQLSKNNLS
jgi:hypothetical protein